MAVPRVFCSSTCYDLKYIRENLKYFIENLGYEPVLSEEGGVFFDPSLDTQESCLAEIPNCQMFVLIIGGRLGAKYHEKDHSVTNEEYHEAVRKKVPIFALVENDVYTDSRVYQHNVANDGIDAREIKYPSVDDVGIFEFIEEVRLNSINNAIVPFHDFTDIESYLRQQWAGMMHHFLTAKNENERIADSMAIMRELNERTEMLSRLILKSVGTDDAKLTAEMYDIIQECDNPVATLLQICLFDTEKIRPLDILNHTSLNSFLENFKIELSSDEGRIDNEYFDISGKEGSVISMTASPTLSRRSEESYDRLRSKLLDMLKKYNVSLKDYRSSHSPGG